MATTKRNKCAKCGRSYTSWTHRRDCLGMSRGEHRAKNSGHSHASRACSAPIWSRILAVASARDAGIVADGAFYNRPPSAQPGGEA
jgi:hypothetical protein